MNNLLLVRGEGFNANFFYFSGSDIDYSFFLKLANKKILLVPKMNEHLAKDSFNGEVVTYKDIWKELPKLLKGKRIFIDGNSLSARVYEKLREFCKPTDVTKKLLVLRMKKKPDEVKKISNAVKITKEILEAIDFYKLKTENEVKNFLLRETFERGFEPAFDPIVAADGHSAYPHYKTSNARIREFVLIDYGVRCEHYCSDISRVFFLKKDKKMLSKYQVLKDILHELVSSLPAVKNSGELTRISEKLFKRYNIPASLHSIGHGIGLDIHEYPRINKKYRDKLAGTTFALEPAFYTNTYGLRYEETIYFDGKKARVLS